MFISEEKGLSSSLDEGGNKSLSYFHIDKIMHQGIKMYTPFTGQIWKAVHLWRIYESQQITLSQR